MRSDFWWLWRMRCALIVWILASAWPAMAQSLGEVWGNLTIDWLASERLVYTLDVEPKVQVTNVTKQSRFANVEVWPSVEFAVSGWLDAHGEFLAVVPCDVPTRRRPGANDPRSPHRRLPSHRRAFRVRRKHNAVTNWRCTRASDRGLSC
jgi:hypothetical protein